MRLQPRGCTTVAGAGMCFAICGSMRARSFFVRFACCALWLLLVGAGFAAILNYQTASGAAGVTPQQWPAQTRIALAADRQTLIMFVHPKCPCSRASLEELNRLLAQCP